MLSILAGMLIGVGGIIYLRVGGPVGASLFAIGLLTILHFRFELFTGKAGLLATNDIKPFKLLTIWLGNFLGTSLMAVLYGATVPG